MMVRLSLKSLLDGDLTGTEREGMRVGGMMCLVGLAIQTGQVSRGLLQVERHRSAYSNLLLQLLLPLVLPYFHLSSFGRIFGQTARLRDDFALRLLFLVQYSVRS